MKLKSIVVAAFAMSTLALAGCSDPCETIVDKINECQGTDLEANPDCDSDTWECQADCYDEASCDEVTGVTPQPNAFSDCVSACQTG